MFNIILSVILILALLYIIYYKRHLTCIDKKTKEENEIIYKENHKLHEECSQLNFQKEIFEKDLRHLNQIIHKAESDKDIALNALKDLQDYLYRTQNHTEQTLQQGLEYYCDSLEKSYIQAEIDFDKNMASLINSYNDKKEECQNKINEIQCELEKIKATRKAAIEASLREEEIKHKLDFYCLQLSPKEINDIDILEKTKLQLTNPRILSMLIWSTYFQKDMTALCNRILGTNTVMGIYKITNQINGKCYIGQSVDISKRWKDHAKCGLGIDAPQGNQLYNDMQTYGIWNFSWELLEQCPREQLNEKEKYYIELYQSKDFGYNATKGNN